MRETRSIVLVAPTWGPNGLLRKFGARVLIPLLEKRWKVILRPHPQSYISERDMLDRLQEELREHSNLHWDDAPDGLRSMARAHVMVSDLSGVVFDFAFVVEKPVITFKFDTEQARSGVGGIALGPMGIDCPGYHWTADHRK